MAEIRKDADAARATRDAAYAEWRRLDNQMTDTAEGVAASPSQPSTEPAPAQPAAPAKPYAQMTEAEKDAEALRRRQAGLL